MVSLQTLQATSKCIVEPASCPARISFSADFLDESEFISICPNRDFERENKSTTPRNAEFEFLSGGNPANMITADELISEGKLLPFWQMHNAEMKLKNISLKNIEEEKSTERNNDKEEPRISWFLDDDPSPRPPTCTVLLKELLRLKKQRPSTLSPSSSSSSSSSCSVGEMTPDDKKDKDKVVKRMKKQLERTRSASIRIRPVINVPICKQGIKSSSLPPLFPLRRSSKLDVRS